MATINYVDFVQERDAASTPLDPSETILAVIVDDVTYRTTLATIVAAGGVSADDGFNIFVGGGGAVIATNTGFTLGCDNVTYGAKSVFMDGASGLLAAGVSLTTGTGNVLIGGAAGCLITTGSHNVGIGDGSLFKISTGYDNVALGTLSLWNGTTANGNIAIGYSSMGNATTGANNVSVGDSSGNCITTGQNNVFIGIQSGGGSNHFNDGIGIGRGASPAAANECVLGPTKANGGMAVGFATRSAPADADISTGQLFFYYDDTAGAAKLKIKAKNSAGTVVTGEVVLT